MNFYAGSLTPLHVSARTTRKMGDEASRCADFVNALTVRIEEISSSVESQ